MNTAKLADGYVRLTTKKGKKLYNEKLQRNFSESVVKAGAAKDFVEV